MPYALKYDPDRGIVRGRFDGPVDAALSMNYAMEASHLMGRHRCTRLLTDARNAKLVMTSEEIYAMPDVVKDAGFPAEARRAVVVSDLDADSRFFETVARDRGQTLRTFQSVEEAERWLTGEGP